MLVTHTLKRSAGIGGGGDVDQVLDDRVDELADGFMVLIATTGFIEVRKPRKLAKRVGLGAK